MKDLCVLPQMDSTVAALGRSGVYRLLAAFYRSEPDAVLLDTLGSAEVRSILIELGVDRECLAPERSGAGNAKERAGLLDELAEEYAALFILPGGVKPYASVWLKGQLCDEPEWKAREFYKNCGLIIPEDVNIFADHLALELDFMGHLSEKQYEELREGNERSAIQSYALQCEFFSGHLGTWVFRFLENLNRYAHHPFYKGAAGLTKTFLEMERDTLGVNPDEVA